MRYTTRRERMKGFIEAMSEMGFDTILLLDPLSFWHLVGSPAADACIISAHGESQLIVNPEQLRSGLVKEETWVQEIREYFPFSLDSVKEYKVIKLSEAIVEALKDIGIEKGKLGIDETRTSASMLHSLENALPNLTIANAFESINDFLGVHPTEGIELLKRAVEVAEIGMETALNTIKDGVKENEVAGEALKAMFANGADRMSFPPQVNSGLRSALSYGYSTGKSIRSGEIVQIDFGPITNGYTGDVSRVTIVGKNKRRRQREIFETVLRANRAAISAVKPGVKASDVDRAARDVIDSTKYAGFFTHHTGHPVGTIFGPWITPTSEIVLREGMAFTIEPGIYVLDYGGMRIEDNVVVTKEGVEVLTKIERTLSCKVV